VVENQFERRLQPCEYPHSLYIANYSTAAATCLAVRRWLFHPKVRGGRYRTERKLFLFFTMELQM
jgi:hypothetical protein